MGGAFPGAQTLCSGRLYPPNGYTLLSTKLVDKIVYELRRREVRVCQLTPPHRPTAVLAPLAGPTRRPHSPLLAGTRTSTPTSTLLQLGRQARNPLAPG